MQKELEGPRQVRIFAPFNGVFSEGWCEKILGEVIKPLVAEHQKEINWFWYSRYVDSRGHDAADCDMTKLPVECFQNETEIHRSVRFRINAFTSSARLIEELANRLIANIGAIHSGWLNYNPVADLGGDRFAPKDSLLQFRETRAKLIADCYHAVSKLHLDRLARSESGDWVPEQNSDLRQNPLGNIFESMIHVFCNTTNTELPVHVYTRGGQIAFGTTVYHPSTEEGWQHAGALPIQY